MENITETTQQTSLEEALEVCGENLNNPTILQGYENIFLGDASPSAAKWRASEVLIGAMAANSEVFTGNILSTYFECGAISTNLVGTPYEIAIGRPNEKFKVGIDTEGEAYKAYSRLFPVPVDRLLNMPRQVIVESLQEASKSDPYALQEKVNNTMRDQNAVDVRIINLAGSKIARYISTLPATIFSTANGQSFPERSIADGELMVDCASQLIFGTKAERFQVIRGIDMAGTTTLSQMSGGR